MSIVFFLVSNVHIFFWAPRCIHPQLPNMFSFHSTTLNQHQNIYFLPNLRWYCGIFWGLWISDQHVVSQHILRRSHLLSNIIILVSICVAIGLVQLCPHSIPLFPISVLAVCLQESQIEVGRSIHDGFQNIPNLWALSCLGFIQWWILGELLTIGFSHTLVYQVVC